jgi:DNA-binding LytR/AlgR family response regulator
VTDALAVLSALIVDDEAPARAELRFQLEQIPAVRVVGEAATAAEALELIRAVGHDVVFLDVALPGPDGMVLAEQLRRATPEPAIVFVTAYDGYAVEAFRLQAVDYLLKPVVPERLAAAVSRVRGRREPAVGEDRPTAERRFVAGHLENRTVPVALSDVLYCETVEKHVEMVVVGGRRYLVRETLQDLEKSLPSDLFLRCHRGGLVNLLHVADIRPFFHGTYTIRLDNGDELPVSRRLARALKQALHL